MSSTQLYAIRRVRIASTWHFGLVLGALLTALPSMLLIWLLLQIVHMLRLLLEGWQALNLFNAPITNQPVIVDFVALLQLSGLNDLIHAIDNQAWLIWLCASLALTFLGGLLVAGIASLFGLFYNAMARVSGGIVLELEPLPATRILPAPETAHSRVTID